ncbi:hypothetical protein niasHT_039101 [Heterodera trifolii]|uniref:GST C-terminal domain-containing protein n=1 Tax=Heterodera trifolii TaxID=157864 RepID=A0ABD2HX89_9BILA
MGRKCPGRKCRAAKVAPQMSYLAGAANVRAANVRAANVRDANGIRPSNTLSAAEQADIQAFCSLIEETLRNAEKYLSWLDDESYELVTKKRYGSVYLWPLNWLLPTLKRREMHNYLADIGWADLPMAKVAERCDKCFHALSIKLGQQQFFVGDQPTELDALAFGHLYTLLTTEMPNKAIVETLSKYPNLIAFCKTIDKEYFSQNF